MDTHDEPNLDWFNRPRNSSNPGPQGFDQTQAWATRGNPFGHRTHPRSRIHLKNWKLIRQKAAAEKNLGKVFREATLALNETRR